MIVCKKRVNGNLDFLDYLLPFVCAFYFTTSSSCGKTPRQNPGEAHTALSAMAKCYNGLCTFKGRGKIHPNNITLFHINSRPLGASHVPQS